MLYVASLHYMWLSIDKKQAIVGRITSLGYYRHMIPPNLLCSRLPSVAVAYQHLLKSESFQQTIELMRPSYLSYYIFVCIIYVNIFVGFGLIAPLEIENSVTNVTLWLQIVNIACQPEMNV